MPAADSNPCIPIAAGKLSKIISIASQVSPAEYYGLSIDYGGGILDEKQIQAIAKEAGLSK